jgi:hypothetical protein
LEVATLADELVSARELAEIAAETDQMNIVQPLRFDQTAMKNELLLFLKPEVFLVKSQDRVGKIISLVFQKMAEYGAQPSGIAVMTGRTLQETGAMSRHYGLINRLSTAASQVITTDEARTIGDALAMPEERLVILGGHEFLSRHPDVSADELDRMWLSERSTKIRSGVYVRPFEADGQTVVLVNGFHPKQLAHYTDPSHRILLVVLHSASDWYLLKNRMVGSTFPDQAEGTSIRGTLYADPTTYGFDDVSISNNAVHLSAGPFEAMFELYNFFGEMLGIDPGRQKPLVLSRMLDQEVEPDLALRVLDNPNIQDGMKTIDLFTATEDMNTDDAIKYWLEHTGATE